MRDLYTKVDEAATFLRARFAEQGVFIRPFGNIIYVTPAFTIAPDDLAALTSAIRQELQRLGTNLESR